MRPNAPAGMPTPSLAASEAVEDNLQNSPEWIGLRLDDTYHKSNQVRLGEHPDNATKSNAFADSVREEATGRLEYVAGLCPD